MSRKRIGDPLNRTLSGLPELALFPSEQEREEALVDISARPSRPRFMIVGAGFIVVAMIIAAVASQLLVSVLALPLAASIAVCSVIMAVTLLISIRALHRRVMKHELRVRLLECGVPVCTNCGYALRGLAPGASRCPECGKELGESERALIAG